LYTFIISLLSAKAPPMSSFLICSS
jgi:hypothetical protein